MLRIAPHPIPVLSLLCFLAGVALPPTYAATSTSIEIKQGAAELKAALEAMPYAAEGKGPMLYILEFSESSYSQRLNRDFPTGPSGVEARHIFFAVSQRTANETAELARTRDINRYHAYMQRKQSAPPYNRDNASIDAFNAVMGPINDIVIPTLKRNGWRAKSLVSPTFFWEENGKLFADGGYRKNHFQTILSSVSGRQSPPPAKSSPIAKKESAPSTPSTPPATSPSQTQTAATPPPDEGNRLDDWTAMYLYHKLANRGVDFDFIANRLDKVVRSDNFDRPAVLKQELTRLQGEFNATDPGIVYTLRVNTGFRYQHEQQRFEVDLFKPGTFIRFNPPIRNTNRGQFEYRVAFANGDSLRYVPMPLDKAREIHEITQKGSISAIMEVRFFGTGDPTGTVDSNNTLRAEIQSLRYSYALYSQPGEQALNVAVNVVPYNASQEPPVLAYKDFNIMGLQPGVPISKIQKTIEDEFGRTGAVNPSKGDDPRLQRGISYNHSGCYSFGNQTAKVGSVCIRAYPDDKGIVRKLVVEQILEGTDWDGVRQALLKKYGAIQETATKARNQYFGWGPRVQKTVTMDEQLAPKRALSASLSGIQSTTARSMNSTRASTNLRIRLIDPNWAGAPETSSAPATAKKGPRL